MSSVFGPTAKAVGLSVNSLHQTDILPYPIHHSSGWRPHPLGWGGKPALIVKIQTRQNFEILSFCACGDSFPIQTVD